MAKSWVRHGFRERSRLPSRADDFTDIGKGYGALVTEDYNTPHGKFTGEISWVRIDIGNDTFEDAAGKQAALAGRRGLRRRRRRPDAAKHGESKCVCPEADPSGSSRL